MTKHTVRRGLSALAAACLAVGAAGVATTPAAYAAPSSTSMVPVDLSRIVDTRAGVGVADAMTNNEVVDVQVTGDVDVVAGPEQLKKTVVPADADAVVLNMTAVEAAADGYFVAWQAGTPRPATSNINYMTGDTVANGVTVPLSADGKISVFSRGGADLLLDVAGYYADGQYTAMAPSRVLDTRLTPANVAAARSITRVKVADNEGDYVALNVTVTNPAEAGYVTVWSTQETPSTDDPSIMGMPQTSNVNYAAGQTVANTVLVEAGKEGYVSLYTMAETALLVDKTHVVTSGQADFATLLNPAQRVMDTRVNIGSDKTTGYRNFDLLSLADKADWDEVGAAIVNVTVTGADADGFAAIGPDLEATGADTSVLNFKAGQTISNRVIIPASFAGNLQAYTNVKADLILDVMGYTRSSSTAMEPVSVDLTAQRGMATYEAADLGDVGGKTVFTVDTGSLPTGFVLASDSVAINAKYNNANSKSIMLGGSGTARTLDLGGLAPDTYTAVLKIKPETGANPVETTVEVPFRVVDPTEGNDPATSVTGTVVATERLDYKSGNDTDTTVGTPNETKTLRVSPYPSASVDVTFDAEYADTAAKVAAANTALGDADVQFGVDSNGMPYLERNYNITVADDSNGTANTVSNAEVGSLTKADNVFTGDVNLSTKDDYSTSASFFIDGDGAGPLAAVQVTFSGSPVTASDKVTAINTALDAASVPVTASLGGSNLVLTHDGAEMAVSDATEEFTTATTSSAASTWVGNVDWDDRLDYSNAADTPTFGTPDKAVSFTVAVGGTPNTVNLAEKYADAAAKLAAINGALSNGVVASYDAEGHLVFTAPGTTAPVVANSSATSTDADDEFGTASSGEESSTSEPMLNGVYGTVTVKYENGPNAPVAGNQGVKVMLPAPFKDGGTTLKLMLGDTDVTTSASLTSAADDTHVITLPNRFALQGANGGELPSELMATFMSATSDGTAADANVAPDGFAATTGREVSFKIEIS